MHADRTLGFTPAAEESTQRKMQFDGLGIDLDRLDEGFDGAVRLLVEQEIEALEIGARQRARFLDDMADIDACRSPAKAEERREKQEATRVRNP